MAADKTNLVWSKLFYFCFYAAAAALFPFLALFYENLGLSGHQIGFLAGILPMVNLLGAPTWGALADKFRYHKLILNITIAGSIIVALVVSQMTVFALLIPNVAVYALLSSPIISIMDNAALTLLADRKNQYGRLRIWGSVGWGISAPLLGYLIERSGLRWAFWGYTGIMLIGLAVLQKISFTGVSPHSPFWKGARIFLSNRSWILFLFLVFAAGSGLGVIFNFLFLYMNDLGASKTMMGVALTVATLTELPIFFFSDRLLSRWSAQSLFVFATVVLVIRTLALSFAREPWMVLITQVFHGLTFSLMWLAGVSFANKIAPAGYGATAQGLFSGVFMGIATAAGAFLGGFLYQDFGGAIMYRTMGISIAISNFIFLIFLWRLNHRESRSQVENLYD